MECLLLQQNYKNIFIRNNYPFLKQTNYNNILEVNKLLNTKSGKIFNKSYEKILNKAFCFTTTNFSETSATVAVAAFNFSKNLVPLNVC